MKRHTILFDINETVLDLGGLSSHFASVFGDSALMPGWFSNLLHSSTVCALTGVKSDFAALASIALDALAARLGRTLDPIDKAQLLAGFAQIPAHRDVIPALVQLQAAGYRTIAFSNSSLALMNAQIVNAGLTSYFDEIISVEPTGSFKPDLLVYQFAAQQLQQPIEQLRLVACHDWDTHGALTAGMHAAYIDRSRAPYHPLYRPTDVTAKDMARLVAMIIDCDCRS
ncbi:haloacid dehalogenase type II [Shewanella sp. NIFS-20-20]|uniref:haloacid dehalogenase type II n=1 Tax=Shewanella sp. NIFS-20-20 TaxID=2853806 RepID=UPI001C4484DC|nr:haloacid dehalogenase type II [Shewanella sp. NIFS-20-20]MBV7314679.1 haloacid dehalogenase type II [Shewanella sp. NIFS-20-20]